MRILTRDMQIIEAIQISDSDFVAERKGRPQNYIVEEQEILMVNGRPFTSGFFANHNDAFNVIAGVRALDTKRWKYADEGIYKSKRVSLLEAHICKGVITHFVDRENYLNLYWSETEGKLYRDSWGAYRIVTKKETDRRMRKIIREIKKIYNNHKGTKVSLKNIHHND